MHISARNWVCFLRWFDLCVGISRAGTSTDSRTASTRKPRSRLSASTLEVELASRVSDPLPSLSPYWLSSLHRSEPSLWSLLNMTPGSDSTHVKIKLWWLVVLGSLVQQHGFSVCASMCLYAFTSTLMHVQLVLCMQSIYVSSWLQPLCSRYFVSKWKSIRSRQYPWCKTRPKVLWHRGLAHHRGMQPKQVTSSFPMMKGEQAMCFSGTVFHQEVNLTQ